MSARGDSAAAQPRCSKRVRQWGEWHPRTQRLKPLYAFTVVYRMLLLIKSATNSWFGLVWAGIYQSPLQWVTPLSAVCALLPGPGSWLVGISPHPPNPLTQLHHSNPPGNPAAFTNVAMTAAVYGGAGSSSSSSGNAYVDGVRANLMAGGDNCSRSLLIGALLAAEVCGRGLNFEPIP